MTAVTNKTTTAATTATATATPMMMNTTIEQLHGLRLAGMASGLQEQLTQAGMTGISFEERIALLVDREVHWRKGVRRNSWTT